MAEPEDPTSIPTEISPGIGGLPPQSSKRLNNLAIEALLGAAGRGGAWQLPTPEEMQRDFPQYEIVGVLGRGGMGAVYKGWQKSLDRFVAIKILPPEVQDFDPQFAERFKHEAKAMARLSHPAICQVFDAGETSSGLLYFVMEFIEGGDLGQKIAAQGRFAPAEANAIACTICDALQFAHESGIVHRDIKPSNILLNSRGQWKVADFGLAKLVGHAGGELTLSDTAMGSAGFASPEALTDGAHVDHRADIYAVGVLLYQMLTGAIPRGAFEMPSQLVPGLDHRFDAILARAMQPDRERRYASAAEMRRDLDRVAAGANSPDSFAVPGKVAPRALVTTGKRQPRTFRLVAIAAGLSVLGGGGWWVTFRPKSATPERVVESKPHMASKEHPFVNSLGMKFVPVPMIGGPSAGQRLLFSVWETRVQDYEVFAVEMKRKWPEPGFPQDSRHPAVNVSWDDAQSFCKWLTSRERKTGRLGATERYRLPTDHEWSCAVGIGEREDPAKSPEEKSQNLLEVFPWGGAWPPPSGAGSYSGEEAVGHETWPGQAILTGYRDNFPETAPVGSFPANRFGLFDLGGNAWEWCEDNFSPTLGSRVMRGASFNNGGRGGVYSAKRDHHPTDDRKNNYGFRIVLAEASSALPGVASPTWRPVPFKLNPKLEGGFVHLVKFDAWHTRDFHITNGAVRASIAWQPDPPGRNDYVKVTARLRDSEHYYAHLTGPTVEVGFYRDRKMIPLRSWAVTPPPAPDEIIPLQLACVGRHLSVWVRGRFLGALEDATLTGGGNVSAQASDGHFQNLEYLDLDGLPEGEALKLLGVVTAP